MKVLKRFPGLVLGLALRVGGRICRQNEQETEKVTIMTKRKDTTEWHSVMDDLE